MEAEWTTAGQPSRQAGECVELSADGLCLLSSTAVIANKQRTNQQQVMKFLSCLIGGQRTGGGGGGGIKKFANNTREVHNDSRIAFPAPSKEGGAVINSAGGFHAAPTSRVLSSVNTKSAVVSALVRKASGLSSVLIASHPSSQNETGNAVARRVLLKSK